MFLNDVVEQCHANLLQKSAALPLAYLISRGVTLLEIKQYRIGYIGNIFSAPSQIDSKFELDQQHFNKWSGSFGKNVRSRIVFPIYDALGNLQGIETKGLDKAAVQKDLKPKYKDSFKLAISGLPEKSMRYYKFYLSETKHSAIFFGLPQSLKSIWETQSIFLTEGIFDCLSILKLYPNCVSSLTANLGVPQKDWLRRYVKKIYLLYDADKIGNAAISKLKQEYGDTFYICPIQFKNKDANGFYMDSSPIEFKFYLENKLKNFL